MLIQPTLLILLGIELELRSETFGSIGIQSPPRSSIKINNIEYHQNTKGHTVVLVDYNSGRVDSVRTFRTDNDASESAAYSLYLSTVPSKLIFIFIISYPSLFISNFQNLETMRLNDLYRPSAISSNSIIEIIDEVFFGKFENIVR